MPFNQGLDHPQQNERENLTRTRGEPASICERAIGPVLGGGLTLCGQTRVATLTWLAYNHRSS
jgi:hypothetical protein